MCVLALAHNYREIVRIQAWGIGVAYQKVEGWLLGRACLFQEIVRVQRRGAETPLYPGQRNPPLLRVEGFRVLGSGIRV